MKKVLLAAALLASVASSALANEESVATATVSPEGVFIVNGAPLADGEHKVMVDGKEMTVHIKDGKEVK